jgi:sec-independent protein translocase protein TatA
MPLMALPGMMELLVIFGVVLLLFGGKKLPQLGGAIGESIKNFKKGVKDDEAPKEKLPESGSSGGSGSSNETKSN